MNGSIKEEHDSDVEILDAEVLKKHWLQNQVCLAKQLMACGKPIPIKWLEFEAFVKENIDWLPSFGLIHAIWMKMCKIEHNDSINSHEEQKKSLSEQSDSSFSSHNSSVKRKKKKCKTDLEQETCPSSRELESSDELYCEDNSSPCSTKSVSAKASGGVDELTDGLKTFSDETNLPSQNIINRKKKHKKKNVELSEQCPVQNLKQEPFDDSVSSPNENLNSETNDLPPPCKEPKKKKEKKKKSNEFLGASSSNEGENNTLNESFSSQNNSLRKSKRKEEANGLNDVPSPPKKKKKKSDVMSEEDAEALREELLTDRIIELELPKVIKEMKGVITKIDKCINNLEIKGKLTKLDKHLSKLENKSLIKKLKKKKKKST